MPRLTRNIPHTGTAPAVIPPTAAHPSRRTLFGGASAALLAAAAMSAGAQPVQAAPAAPGGELDAELIAACEQFTECEREYDRLTPIADVVPGEETDESRAADAAMD